MEVVVRNSYEPRKAVKTRVYVGKPDINSFCSACLSSVEKDVLHTCGKCMQCCTCCVCPECHLSSISIRCSACQLCHSCCKCYSCKHCSAPHTSKQLMCSSCGRGKSNGCGCCNCTESAVKFTRRSVNLLMYAATAQEHLTTNKSKRLLSAEIEVCGVADSVHNLNEILRKWSCSVVSDGSLPSTGFEINSHPASGDFYTAQIEDIEAGLMSARAHVDYRAGCHIHVDTRDFGYTTVAKLLRIFASVEAGLFQLVPGFRASSTMCVYWTPQYLRLIHAAERELANTTPDTRKETILYRRAILEALYKSYSKSVVTERRRNKSLSGRYRGINLHSWFYRGTIECRIPVGTIYARNIINWGLLLANIVDVAASRSMEEVKYMTGPLERVFTTPTSYQTEFAATPLLFKEASLDLLKNLAPSHETRDWIIERAKWARRFSTQADYKEQF